MQRNNDSYSTRADIKTVVKRWCDVDVIVYRLFHTPDFLNVTLLQPVSMDAVMKTCNTNQRYQHQQANNSYIIF